jgi:branched-chain amino acid transport system substrate-binding protein
MNWTLNIIGTAVGAAMSIAAVTASADVVKVGLISDFTGAFATWGTQMQQAVEAYQAVHGKTVKGPDGKTHEVQFVYRDAASQGPDKAKQLAEELVLREKVKFLTGFALSPHAMAVADIANQAKIPVVIMNAATASIVRGSPYYVRVSMTIPQHVVPLAQWAYKSGIRKIYMITSDYAPGHDAEAYFSKTFKAAGGEIIGSDRSPIKETNYGVYVEKVLQAKPDALYMFQPAGAPSVALVKAYSERGLKAAGIKLLGTGETQELFLPNFGDDVIGTVTSFHYTETNDRPQNKQLRAQLQKMFGAKATPDIASVAAWDGTGLIQQAIAKLGPNADGLKYVEFMKTAKFDSPRGPMEIDPVERDVVQNIYIRRVERKDGKLVNIDIDTIPMVKDQWKIDNPPKPK